MYIIQNCSCVTSHTESSFPSTIGPETSDRGKVRLEVWKYQTCGWIAQAHLTNISGPCIVFKTNKNRYRNRIHEGQLFRQAWLVRSKDSRHKIVFLLCFTAICDCVSKKFVRRGFALVVYLRALELSPKVPAFKSSALSLCSLCLCSVMRESVLCYQLTG